MSDHLRIKLTEFYCWRCQEVFQGYPQSPSTEFGGWKPDPKGIWAGIHKKCGEMGQWIHKINK